MHYTPNYTTHREQMKLDEIEGNVLRTIVHQSCSKQKLKKKTGQFKPYFSFPSSSLSGHSIGGKFVSYGATTNPYQSLGRRALFILGWKLWKWDWTLSHKSTSNCWMGWRHIGGVGGAFGRQCSLSATNKAQGQCNSLPWGGGGLGVRSYLIWKTSSQGVGTETSEPFENPVI